MVENQNPQFQNLKLKMKDMETMPLRKSAGQGIRCKDNASSAVTDNNPLKSS